MINIFHEVTSPKVTISSKEITLPSTKGSSRTLKCTVVGEPSPTIQWFLGGTTMIQSATQPLLTVQFTFATDITSTYRCTRKDPNLRPVICKMNYTCRAMFPIDVPSAEPAEATTQVTAKLSKKRRVFIMSSCLCSFDLSTVFFSYLDKQQGFYHHLFHQLANKF